MLYARLRDIAGDACFEARTSFAPLEPSRYPGKRLAPGGGHLHQLQPIEEGDEAEIGQRALFAQQPGTVLERLFHIAKEAAKAEQRISDVR